MLFIIFTRKFIKLPKANNLVNMPTVIRLYTAKYSFEKPNYTVENRKAAEVLDAYICPVSGFVNNATLFLPLKYSDKNVEFSTADLIIIQELKGFNPYKMDLGASQNCRRTVDMVTSFKQFNVAKSFDIFKLRKLNNNAYEIFANPEDGITSVAVPKRKNHKIFELAPNAAFAYKINYKIDSTFTKGKQRTYFENTYLFENLGEITDIKYLPNNQMAVQCKLPSNNYKIIDERKNLW